jgi:ribosomal protein S18 acetylase RimI-like enzyme
LHDQGLDQSFLCQLGITFLTSMYSYFIKHELVYVYTEDEQVRGFISASLSTDKVMRRFVTSSPEGIFHILIAVLRKPSLLKSIYETYSSSHSTVNLPSIELLSIVVSETVRQGGVGTQLLRALETELKRLGVETYKVVAGEKLLSANRFYIKNGFEKAAEVVIHGEDVSNVYVKYIIPPNYTRLKRLKALRK